MNCMNIVCPEGENAALNIPWFVSHNYLVFVPDIHFTIGKVGESVLHTINGVVSYLKKLPGVDSMRIGIQGFSYGGWETNYPYYTFLFFCCCCCHLGSM